MERERDVVGHLRAFESINFHINFQLPFGILERGEEKAILEKEPI